MVHIFRNSFKNKKFPFQNNILMLIEFLKNIILILIEIIILLELHNNSNKLTYTFAKHELSLQCNVCFYSNVSGFPAHYAYVLN